MEESHRRRRRPLRALIGLLAALTGAANVAVAQVSPGNAYDIPTVDDAARTPLLGCAAILLLVAVWAIATSRGARPAGGEKAPAEETVAAGEQAGERDDDHDVPAEPAPGIEPLPARPWAKAVAAQLPAEAAESPADVAAPAPAPEPVPASPAPAPVPPASPPVVLHRLRGQGWYVADNVSLSRTGIDHVAVGPAGVLAVQVTSTDSADAADLPLDRARAGAAQFQRLLLDKELDLEVVPAMLAWGDNLRPMPGGVIVVDSVAVLSGPQAGEWISELAGKELLDPAKVRAVRDVLADIVLGGMSDSPVTDHVRA